MRHQSHTTNKELLKIFGKQKLLNMRLVHVEPSAKKTKSNKIIKKGNIVKVFTGDGLWVLLDKDAKNQES